MVCDHEWQISLIVPLRFLMVSNDKTILQTRMFCIKCKDAKWVDVPTVIDPEDGR